MSWEERAAWLCAYWLISVWPMFFLAANALWFDPGSSLEKMQAAAIAWVALNALLTPIWALRLAYAKGAKRGANPATRS